MNLENQLALSYYQEIAVLNEEHHISVVQHRETKKIYVKKLLTVYNGEVYRRLQQLNLEGVPRIREFLEGEGQAVLIEEYISGDTLQEKIDACRLTEKDIRRYTGELCRILNSLHQQEPPMIHRDIKPSNIIITPEDRVVLIDFNAAKSYSGKSRGHHADWDKRLCGSGAVWFWKLIPAYGYLRDGGVDQGTDRTDPCI